MFYKYKFFIFFLYIFFSIHSFESLAARVGPSIYSLSSRPEVGSYQNREEGWRWRRSLNFIGLQDHIDEIHRAFCRKEKILTRKALELHASEGGEGKWTKNYAMGDVSIIYTSGEEDSSLKLMQTKITDVRDDGAVRDAQIVFQSGFVLHPNEDNMHDSLEDEDIDSPALIAFQDLESTIHASTRKEFKNSLRDVFLSAGRRVLRSDLIRTEVAKGSIRPHIAKELIDQRMNEIVHSPERDFSSYYMHSEQYMRFYLEDNEVQDRLIHDLSIRMPRGSVVKAIIVNLHSRLDLCMRCSQTWAAELERPDGVFSNIWRKLNDRARYYHFAVSKDCRVFLLASSRDNYDDSISRVSRRFYGVDLAFKKPLDLSDIAMPEFEQARIDCPHDPRFASKSMIAARI